MGFLFFSNKTISVLGLMWSLEKVFDACTLVQIGLFSHHSSQGTEMHTSDFFLLLQQQFLHADNNHSRV